MQAGLEPWEQRLYFSVMRDGDRVLLVGSGGGRELLPFGARGYLVTGIDQVPALMAAARHHLDARRLTATLIAGPIETAELPDTYDVVIFSACVYGYLPGSGSRRATLARLKSHLAPDGRLVASYMDGHAASPLGLWLMRATGWLARSDWRADPEDTFAPGPSRQRLPFYERRMSADAVRRELTQAGFQLIKDEAVRRGDAPSQLSAHDDSLSFDRGSPSLSPAMYCRCELGSEQVMLNLRDGTYYGLDEAGSEIWKLLQKPITVSEICDAIVGAFDVDAERCHRDVVRLLSDLVDRGLIDFRTSP